MRSTIVCVFAVAATFVGQSLAAPVSINTPEKRANFDEDCEKPTPGGSSPVAVPSAANVTANTLAAPPVTTSQSLTSVIVQSTSSTAAPVTATTHTSAVANQATTQLTTSVVASSAAPASQNSTVTAAVAQSSVHQVQSESVTITTSTIIETTQVDSTFVVTVGGSSATSSVPAARVTTSTTQPANTAAAATQATTSAAATTQAITVAATTRTTVATTTTQAPTPSTTATPAATTSSTTTQTTPPAAQSSSTTSITTTLATTAAPSTSVTTSLATTASPVESPSTSVDATSAQEPSNVPTTSPNKGTVNPGGAGNVTVTSPNTVNGTDNPSTSPAATVPSGSGTQHLPLTFVNNFAGEVNAYVTGLDLNNEVVFLQANGQWFKPSGASTTPAKIADEIAIPVGGQGSKLTVTLPDFIVSARIWFAAGELQFFTVSNTEGMISLVEPSSANPADPSAAISWGFVELTNTPNGLYANISYVDFVGLVLGMSMVAGDGTVQSAPGLQANAVSQICKDLKAQTAIDGQPWGDLCQTDSAGNPLRITAPPDYISVNANAWNGYYDNYIDQVWAKYASEPLTFNTQNSAGNVTCQVSGDTLTCNGASRGFTKPAVADIWGCNSGPFLIEEADNAITTAIVPRLCAAFDRTTLLLAGGNVQPSLPSSSYYLQGPTNWYSATVHKYEIDDKGYAFSYDDVNPNGNENASGVVSDGNPQSLTVTIGGPSS